MFGGDVPSSGAATAGRRGILLDFAAAPSLSTFRRVQPGLMPRTVETFYPQWLRVLAFDMQGTLALLSAGYRSFQVKVVHETTRKPVAKVQVQLVLSSQKRLGIEVATDGKGIARLLVPANAKTVEALAVQPKHSLWPMLVSKPSVTGKSLTVAKPLTLCEQSSPPTPTRTAKVYGSE
jgi:hypothetical protein